MAEHDDAIPEGERVEDGPFSGDRRSSPPVNLEVINYQVGALQTSLDKGLFTLERTVERGFEGVDRRLGRIEERQTAMEKKQERSDARLEALEAFRHEQESQDKEAYTLQRADLKLAMDETAEARITRKLITTAVGIVGAAGTLAGILAALGVFH